MLPIILSASLISCSDAITLISRIEKSTDLDNKVREELIYEIKNVSPKDCFE